MIHSHQFYPEQQIEFLGKILCRASCFDLKWHDFYAIQLGFYAILSLKFDHVKGIFLKISNDLEKYDVFIPARWI